MSQRNKRIARQEGQRYFSSPADVDTFLKQMGVEAHFDDLTSPAGAQGPAQFTPGTARAVGLKNPHDPFQAYGAAAKLMRSYLDTYHGSWKDALVAYNAGPGRVGKALPGETQHYLQSILGSSRPVAGGKAQTGAQSVSSAAGATAESLFTSTFDQAGYDRAQKRSLLAGYLSQHGNPNSVLFKSGLLSTAAPNPADFTSQALTMRPSTSSPAAAAPASSAGRAPRPGRLVIAPTANRPGAGIKPIVKRFVSDVAGAYGKPITIGTGTNHNRLTVDGNVSDHWDGHASDLPVPVDSRQGDQIAAHALELAGVSPKQARAMAQKGGLYTLTPKSGPFAGHRIQVIWKTYEGGNHHNHVHVGIR